MLPTLFEREAEIAVLDRLLDDLANGHGGVCLIVGPAGIGKSALLNHARAHRPDGVGLLESTCTPLARHIPFAVMRDWFEFAARRTPVGAEPFDGPAERFRRIGEEGSFAPGDLSYAARWALESMCQHQGPQLLVVEDAHWADSDSLQALELLLGGITDLPVLVLLVVRSTEPSSGEVLDRVDHGATVIEPAPLSVGAVARLATSCGVTTSAQAVHELTGGVPFLVLQLLESQGEGPPRTVVASTRARLGALSEGAGAVMTAVCVLSGTGNLTEVATLAGQSPLQAAMHLRELYSAGLVAGVDHESPTALHPLVSEAILHEIDPVTLSTLHLRAAWILRRAGYAEATVAAHLLKTLPGNSSLVRDVLHEQGLRALSAGAVPTGMAHLQRAMAECPLSAESAELVATTARAHARMGEVEQSLTLFDQAAALVSDPHAAVLFRAEACRGLVHAGRMDRARDLLVQLLDEIGPHGDLETRKALVAGAAMVGALDGLEEELQRLIASILDHPADQDSHTDKALLAAGAAVLAFVGFGHELALDLNRRASYHHGLVADNADEDFVPLLVATNFGWCHEWPAGLELVDRSIEDARRASSSLSFATASACRADLRLQMGDINNALLDFEAALQLRGKGWRAFEAAALSGVVECHLARGELDLAARYIEELRSRNDVGVDRARTLLVLGYHQTALGDLREALRLVQEAGKVAAVAAPGPAIVPWRRAEITLLHGLGRDEDASAALGRYETVAETWGSARVLADIHHLTGLLSPGPERAAHYERALELVPAGSRDRLRALIETGLAELLATSESQQDRLRAAELAQAAASYANDQSVVDLASRAGAVLKQLGRQAHGGPSSLTPGERRVVALAVAGRTNKEIAAALFVTLKTVEAYLSVIYRKLGIRGRAELAAAMEHPEGGITLL